MERVFSLSALDSLLQDPEGKADLRHQLECDELEDRRPKYTSRHLDRPVVVVSSEVNPWSKTGGLAMVAGSYGYEFAMRGHRTMVVSPRYAAYDGAHYLGYAKIWLDGREHEVQFFHLYQDLGDGHGTDYIFVGHDCFMRGGLYCDPNTGKEYPDNLFRFSLLTVAALEAPLVLNIRGHTFGQDRVDTVRCLMFKFCRSVTQKKMLRGCIGHRILNDLHNGKAFMDVSKKVCRLYRLFTKRRT